MNNPKKNHLLSALPEQEYQRFESSLELVQLSLGDILLEPNKQSKSFYFPIQGVISLISTMNNGSSSEISLIGVEGMVGIFPFLGAGTPCNLSVVQSQGWAMKIELEALQTEYDRGEMLQKLLLQYALKLFNQVSQIAACNNHHTVRQRTARWLLMFDDRHEQEILLITQRLLSRLLGVRRTGITEVAMKMQQQGIIDYHRGKIKILDRNALEQVACECYQVLKIWSSI